MFLMTSLTAENMLLYLENKIGTFADFALKAIFAILIYFVVKKLIDKLCKLLKKNMLKFHADEAMTSFVVSLVRYTLQIFLVLTIIVQLKIVKESSITAAIASAGVAVSLALQGGLSNFAGGVLILLLRPFKVGDYIVIPGEGQEGTVRKIEMYYTTITSIDNRTILIPNAGLTNNTIVNVTAMDKRKLEIKIGVSYNSDLQKVKRLLERLVEEETRFMPEERQFFIDEFSDSAIIVGFRAWVATDQYWPVKWSMNEKIKAAFDETGVEIPFPQMDVHLKS